MVSGLFSARLFNPDNFTPDVLTFKGFDNSGLKSTGLNNPPIIPIIVIFVMRILEKIKWHV